MTKIKLCGLMRDCDIDYVNELEPDFVGYVFVPDRRRFVPYEKAHQMTQKLKSSITPVGVFIDETIETICNLVSDGTIRAVQLHGSESFEYIKKLKQELNGCPIIQAIQVHEASDLQKVRISPADYVLLDSGTGTGKTFDWSLLENINRDFFLAGGLSSDNVTEAITSLHPYGVDTSSALETDGVKDFQKMKAFVDAVRKTSNV